MHRKVATVTANLILSFVCASCGATPLTSTWRAPAAENAPFHRVLATFVSMDLPLRRSMEDRLAMKIPRSFPAYQTVPDLSLGDRERARDQLRGRLFDAAVVMRVVDVRNVQSYRPGGDWYTGYPRFYDFWGPSWTAVRDPGYAVIDRAVFVETMVYSLSEDKLVWAGRTTTDSTQSVNELVDRTVDAVAKELRSKQVIR
jgi:hypothetical protein